MGKEVAEFLGTVVSHDNESNHLLTEKGDRFADVRAWSELRSFVDPNRVMDAHPRMEECDRIQCEMAKFIVEAINEKLERDGQGKKGIWRESKDGEVMIET